MNKYRLAYGGGGFGQERFASKINPIWKPYKGCKHWAHLNIGETTRGKFFLANPLPETINEDDQCWIIMRIA